MYRSDLNSGFPTPPVEVLHHWIAGWVEVPVPVPVLLKAFETFNRYTDDGTNYYADVCLKDAEGNWLPMEKLDTPDREDFFESLRKHLHNWRLSNEPKYRYRHLVMRQIAVLEDLLDESDLSANTLLEMNSLLAKAVSLGNA